MGDKAKYRKALGLAVMLSFMAGPTWGRKTFTEDFSLAVSVFNDAEVPAGTVRQAEDVASRIFRRAGLTVSWVNCGLPDEPPQQVHFCTEAAYPSHLHIRIVRHGRDLPESTFGISYLEADGSGCYSTVFLERVEELRNKFPMDLASLLGHVAAHEIAHLLLGTNSHSPRGIMQARWNAAELMDAGRGALIFSAAEAQRMRRRVAAAEIYKANAPIQVAKEAGR